MHFETLGKKEFLCDVFPLIDLKRKIKVAKWLSGRKMVQACCRPETKQAETKIKDQG